MNREELSASETLIMKAVWDHGEDITVKDLIERLQEQYDKDYKRTTVATFLVRLSDKRFISTYRIGRLSFVHAEKTKEEYKQYIAQRDTRFWFAGKGSGFLAALFGTEKPDAEDIRRMREILDELDGNAAD